MASDLPPYWTESHAEEYHRISVDAATFASVAQVVMGTFDASYRIGVGRDARNLRGYSNLEVTRVERLENAVVYESYLRCRQRMMARAGVEPFKKITGLVDRHNGPAPESEVLLYDQGVSDLNNVLLPDVNEYYLLHGTKSEFVESIAQTGLKRARINFKSAEYGGLFGQGIYMAESVSKADQYTDDSRRRRVIGTPLTLLLVRVVLGNICLMNPLGSSMKKYKFTSAPCRTCRRDHCQRHASTYDSVLGLTNGRKRMLFREFIIYDNAQCYPEYIVTYRRLA